jgi:hypothetical protein
MDKVSNLFASKQVTPEAHSAEEVIANVHKMTTQRRVKTGEAPIVTRIKA